MRYSKLIILFLFGVHFVLFSCAKRNPESTEVGVILPLTGGAAAYGQSSKNGIELALQEINSRGGLNGKKIVAVYEDSQADPKNAVTAFQKLANVNGVSIVLGPMTSSEVLAVAPIAETRKIVLFTPTASAPEISNAGDYIFRNLTSDSYDGQAMADFAFNKLGFKQASICYLNNDFGLGLIKAFKAEFEKHGGIIRTVESFETNATDFRSQIERIKSTKAPAVFLVGGKEMARFLRQAHELKAEVTVLSIAVFEDPEILMIAGEAANGAYYTFRTYDPSADDSVTANFVAAYKARNGKEPEIYAALSYDAVQLAVEAMKIMGTTSDEIRRGLYAIRDYPGVTGTTSFDTLGDVIKPIGIKTVKNGDFVWIEKP